jgi:hypothetical protein
MRFARARHTAPDESEDHSQTIVNTSITGGVFIFPRRPAVRAVTDPPELLASSGNLLS